jgi:hypothetical protein
MKNCSLQAGELGLTDQEINLIEDNVEKGLKDNTKLQDLIKKNTSAQERLKTSGLKDTQEGLQREIDANDLLHKEYLEGVKKSGGDVKAENKDNAARIKEIRDRFEKKKDTIRASDTIEREALDTSKQLARELKAFTKQTESNIVRNYVRGNPEAARRSILRNQLSDGKETLKNIFDQDYVTPTSIVSVHKRMLNTLGSGTEDLVEAALKTPDDITSPAVKELHDHLIDGINAEATSLGVLEKHGLKEDQRPFSMHFDAVRTKFFKQGFGRTIKESTGAVSVFDKDGLDDFIYDWKAAVGEDELNAMIAKAYPHKTIAPTIQEAFEDLRRDLVIGNLPILDFSNPKFLTDGKYSYMVKKYSGKNIIGNLLSFANRKAYTLSLSKVTGGRLTKEDFILDRNISDTKRKAYKALMDRGYGEQVGTSAARHARQKILNNYGKLAVAVRPLTMYLSPISDRGGAKALANMEKGTIASIPSEFLGGFGDAVKQLTAIMWQSPEVKDVTGKMSDLLHVYNDANMHRYNVDDSEFGELGLFDKTVGKFSKATINHFHVQDSALRVVAAKDASNTIREYAKTPFNALPDTYKNTLVNKYSINENDWKEIVQVSKNNEFVTSDKFKGSLANKVAAMELTTEMRAMPNAYKLAPGLAESIKGTRYGAELHQALGMFWGFSLRMITFGFNHSLSTGGKIGVVNWAARSMARGFVPNMVFTGLVTLATTGSFSQTMDALSDPATWADNLLGGFSRDISLLSSLFSPNNAAYNTSSPLLRDSWHTVASVASAGKAIVNNDQRKAAVIMLNNVLNIATPIGQTPLKTYFKDLIKEMPKDDLSVGDYVKQL